MAGCGAPTSFGSTSVSSAVWRRCRKPRSDSTSITNAAMKEMRYAFKVFAPYRDVHKVSVFGSARTRPGDPDYEQARAFGKTMVEHGWMVVTGAGPGFVTARSAA